MTASTQHIAQHLFKAGSLDDVSVKQIENFCAQYPFFNVGHYLLSKKLLKEKADGFLEETKKTALYFNNPFWLQWLLENAIDKKLPDEKTAPANEEGIIESAKIHSSETVSVADETTHSGNNEKNIESTTKPATKEEELVFSPYHTLDYFASLGIKLVLDDNANDKFGKQLKSFTDWLKTMKRLPQKNEEAAADTAAQASIEGFAAHSLQQKEIITEAMAEVLGKQGKKESAIDLYTKLSLLNPAKSAYFAAKIEHLKEH
jgi:hypothetical protein